MVNRRTVSDLSPEIAGRPFCALKTALTEGGDSFRVIETKHPDQTKPIRA